MNHPFEKLAGFISALELALEKDDWEEVAQLDLSVRPIVNECTSLSLKKGEKATLSELLQRLQSLYDQLSAENIGRRSVLGAELKKLHKERKAISQYIQSSGY
ncbi:flagellar protein FliT [Alkalimarinus alittae]|uniref:Flagellar protein FliT n=1 Tax=Alkalimarinus alittae TaxID=2961619 RepID=A0ABY6MYQ0_9ALTE|nr:flagellar protein FliT [Alkalimarinus alittae]UZE94968.1 flagellar protein FliT [Alkalimarinus alittae]